MSGTNASTSGFGCRLKAFCAVSLLMACPASAPAAAQGVGGNVGGYCNIIPAAPVVTKGSAALSGGGNSVSMDFTGTGSFDDRLGHGLEVSGNLQLPVDSNGNCSYTLTSGRGVLWNSTAGAARTYTVDAYDKSSAAAHTPVTLAAHSALPVTVSTFQTTATSDTVVIDFIVPATGTIVLPSGLYTDTLTLTVAPS